MRLLVVGAGATGAYYGAVAARGGADVTLLARGAHGEALRDGGVQVKSPLGDFHVRPRVALSPAELGDDRFDVVLVTVKAGDLPGVLPDAARRVAPGGALVTGQNGVEAETLAAPFVPHTALVGAILVVTVRVSAPGVIEHFGLGHFLCGAPFPEGAPAARQVAAALAEVGLAAHYTADLAVARWSKLVWNNAWNVLSALTRRTTAALARDPRTRELAVGMMREVEAIARASGVTLPDGIVELNLGQVFESPTSMLQDVLAGRPIEADAICGVVVRRGAQLGVPTPLNATLWPVLAALVPEPPAR